MAIFRDTGAVDAVAALRAVGGEQPTVHRTTCRMRGPPAAVPAWLAKLGMRINMRGCTQVKAAQGNTATTPTIAMHNRVCGSYDMNVHKKVRTWCFRRDSLQPFAASLVPTAAATRPPDAGHGRPQNAPTMAVTPNSSPSPTTHCTEQPPEHTA